jgi:NAD(P)-dependent dehydrogenase (short-subunit alcohol dehydrogenase family)
MVEMKSRPLAMVTGAGRGLGLAVARGLARDGHQVLLAVRRPAEADDALGAVRTEGGGAALVELDVTAGVAGERAAAHVDEHGGSLAVLVNNAGVALGDLDEFVARRTIAVNVDGPRRITAALAPKMRAGGRIVMVSSGMGELSAFSERLRRRFLAPDIELRDVEELCEEFIADVALDRHTDRGWPGSAYRVSKAALNALTRIFARQYPALKVNAVCPGWVRTDMGGPGATRSVDEGAAGILWATRVPEDGPSGGLFRDGERIGW